MSDGINLQLFRLDYQSRQFGSSLLIHADGFEWMGRSPENSVHAIVTDPPYGVKEYDFDQLTKRSNGKGGIWRIPPSFDGHTRSPLPRFTALNPKEREHTASLLPGVGQTRGASFCVLVGIYFLPVTPFCRNLSFPQW